MQFAKLPRSYAGEMYPLAISKPIINNKSNFLTHLNIHSIKVHHMILQHHILQVHLATSHFKHLVLSY